MALRGVVDVRDGHGSQMSAVLTDVMNTSSDWGVQCCLKKHGNRDAGLNTKQLPAMVFVCIILNTILVHICIMY